MSLTMSQRDGVTVLTIVSNPKSKWPLLCQILSTMCCSPVCSVSQGVKQRLGRVDTALGTIQIFIGVLAFAVGGLIRVVLRWSWMDNIFGLAPVFIVSGIMCILMERFGSPSLVVLTAIVNMVSAGVAIVAIVVYGVELWETQNMWSRHSEQVIIAALDIVMILIVTLQLCAAISSGILGLKTLCKKKGDRKSEEAPEIYKPLINKDLYIPAV